MELGGGISIQLVTAVAFVATKLEAFADRGGSNALSSHDLEDILNIVDGREQLAAELKLAPPALQAAVREAFVGLLSNPDFSNILPGLLAEPERASLVLRRLENMSA